MDSTMANSRISVTSTRAIAYVLRGSWVAECPRDECANVEFVDPRQNPKTKSTREMFYCTYCHMVAGINWPTNADEIMVPLDRRPIPRTRNWYPKDHPEAIRFNIEHGQTVQDLWEENREHGVD